MLLIKVFTRGQQRKTLPKHCLVIHVDTIFIIYVVFQPPGGVSGVPGAQPLLPNTMDPTRQQSPYPGV